jgi:hypothetical protein
VVLLNEVFIIAVVYFVIDSVRKLLDTPSYNFTPFTIVLLFSFASHILCYNQEKQNTMQAQSNTGRAEYGKEVTPLPYLQAS